MNHTVFIHLKTTDQLSRRPLEQIFVIHKFWEIVTFKQTQSETWKNMKAEFRPTDQPELDNYTRTKVTPSRILKSSFNNRQKNRIIEEFFYSRFKLLHYYSIKRMYQIHETKDRRSTHKKFTTLKEKKSLIIRRRWGKMSKETWFCLDSSFKGCLVALDC